MVRARYVLSLYKERNYRDKCMDGDQCCFSRQSTFKLNKLNLRLAKKFNNSGHDFENLLLCDIRSDRITVIFTAVYMMLANALMLNLLIAIFNFRYENVQKRATKLSCYLR